MTCKQISKGILKKRLALFFMITLSCLITILAVGQTPENWKLEKMPAELEKDFALSALPPHLRQGAAVYLLNPEKGYYIAQEGSNGFVCFVARTEWEWAVFSPDIATPMAYDAEGARTIFQVYMDVAAMRASGKFTPGEVRDSIVRGIGSGYYKTPKTGISYMLSPLMRNYSGDPGKNEVVTMSGPHYMFYAPYLTDADIGNLPGAQGRGPVVVNPGDNILGVKKGPFGYIIMPAGVTETAAIIKDSKGLSDRLVAYKTYFRTPPVAMHH